MPHTISQKLLSTPILSFKGWHSHIQAKLLHSKQYILASKNSSNLPLSELFKGFPSFYLAPNFIFAHLNNNAIPNFPIQLLLNVFYLLSLQSVLREKFRCQVIRYIHLKWICFIYFLWLWGLHVAVFRCLYHSSHKCQMLCA